MEEIDATVDHLLGDITLSEEKEIGYSSASEMELRLYLDQLALF